MGTTTVYYNIQPQSEATWKEDCAGDYIDNLKRDPSTPSGLLVLDAMEADGPLRLTLDDQTPGIKETTEAWLTEKGFRLTEVAAKP